MFLDHFDMLILKIILKTIKKYYFDIFQSKKYFKKPPQPHFQTHQQVLYMYDYEDQTMKINSILFKREY